MMFIFMVAETRKTLNNTTKFLFKCTGSAKLRGTSGYLDRAFSPHPNRLRRLQIPAGRYQKHTHQFFNTFSAFINFHFSVLKANQKDIKRRPY